MKPLLAICLSLLLFSCGGLPERPDGWMCSLRAEYGKLYCNRIKDPSKAQEFEIADPLFRGAQCMDLGTFDAYTKYVYELKRRLVTCEGKP